MVGLTGRAPAWPGALKLPGAAVQQTYKYHTPERQCVTCVIYLWILIISIHPSRFGKGLSRFDRHCYSWMGTYAWNILYSTILHAESRAPSRRRPPRARPVRPDTRIWLRALRLCMHFAYILSEDPCTSQILCFESLHLFWIHPKTINRLILKWVNSWKNSFIYNHLTLYGFTLGYSI